VVETRDFYQTAILNTRTDSFTSQAPSDLYYKQPQTAAILTAKRSWLGRVYLDWSQFPFVEESGIFGALPNGAHYTAVRFQDLRFAYNALFLRGRRGNPLRGTVIIAPDGKVDEMRMGDRVQK
jgi:inner membrane protein